MDTALAVHRFHFAFTITYHYLFPQLTMGLALLIFLMKSLAIKTQKEEWNQAARFWIRLFAINFAMGVVTGIPMEFQFGTGWSRFSVFAGGVIGQSLAMEGVFAFFLESSFLGILLFGEKRFGPRVHWVASLLVFVGSWLSGYFIVITDAWMQHPRGYELMANGGVALTSLGQFLLNPWGLWQYLHTMMGTTVTAAVFVSATGAFYLLQDREVDVAKRFLRLGVPAGLIAAIALAFPTGDFHARMVAKHQPAALAAMEGLFKSEAGAPLVLIGQPDVERRSLDNPIKIPWALSFLTTSRLRSEVPGLDTFPERDWPDNIPLLYFAYHIMVGLGTIFILLLGLNMVWLARGKLFQNRFFLWTLVILFPFPYITNTAGWLTAELGRQPWLVYGLLRTKDGYSNTVSAGNGIFTLMGFMGMYTLLSLLFILLMWREIQRGPKAESSH
jgi:cytochrome d ubiquinol oxidase subunit I